MPTQVSNPLDYSTVIYWQSSFSYFFRQTLKWKLKSINCCRARSAANELFIKLLKRVAEIRPALSLYACMCMQMCMCVCDFRSKSYLLGNLEATSSWSQHFSPEQTLATQMIQQYLTFLSLGKQRQVLTCKHTHMRGKSAGWYLLFN